MANINLNITINHPAAISTTVRYARIDNTNNPTFTTIPGITNGTFTISNVPNGQYRIGVTPIYADGRTCSETIQDTPPCTGVISFSAALISGNIVVAYSLTNTTPYVKVNISYPNGGSFTNTYLNTGTNIVVTPPAGVYGDYSVTIQPVCDIDSGFFGAATAPAIITISAPANSSMHNGTGGALAPCSLTAFSSSGSQLIFLSASVPNGGNVTFFLPDGLYNTLQITYGSGTVTNASLTTGSGTYTGTVSAPTVTFSNVTVSGGIVITLT